MTVRIDNSGVDKFGEAFPVIFAILVILMLVVIAANFILRSSQMQEPNGISWNVKMESVCD